MTSIIHALACIPETELDPNGRYVAVQHWPDGVYLLSAADYAERKRDIHDAGAFTASWWRPEDAERLEPGQLYDRTMDITFGVADWVAMRAEAAEAERKRVTLARVEHDPVPDSPFAVAVIAVTQDGRRHRVTVARDCQSCASCGQSLGQHGGGDPGAAEAYRRLYPRDEAEAARQLASWQTGVKLAASRPHAYQRDPSRFSNVIAWRTYMDLEFPGDSPPWLAGAFRRWSPESVRLGEAYAAGDIDGEAYDVIGARFTWEWWRYHDAAAAAWTERAARDKRIRPAGDYLTFPTVITRSGRGAF